MIARIVALLVLVAVVGGGAWYVFRDTPQKKVLRWREEARKLLETSADIEKAEALNEQVLQIIPTSAHDLVFKGQLNERKGTTAGLVEALAAYDKVLSTGDPAVQVVALMKARACRSLGMISQAQGLLLSVAEAYPFLAMSELGETALAAFSAPEALRYFAKARDAAVTKAEQARASEGIADAHSLLVALKRTPPAAGLAPDEAARQRAEQEAAHESSRRSAREALRAALELVKTEEVPTSRDEAIRRLVWAASVCEKLGAVKDPGETPCFDGVVLLRDKPKDYGPILREMAPAGVLRRGALRLAAARDEGPSLERLGGAADLEREAEADFLEALELSPEEAKALFSKAEAARAPASEREPSAEEGDGKASPGSLTATEYLRRLIAVSRVYLATSQFRKLAGDTTRLSLSRRIADAMESGVPGASEVFAVLVGFARLRGGETAEGERLTEKYLSSLPDGSRARAVVDLAENALLLLPGDPLCFTYLDKFEASGGKPLELVGKRLSILLRARSQKALEAEASARLEAVLAAAARGLESPGEHLGLAKVLYGLKGRDASIEVVRRTRERFPQDPGAARVFADLMLERALDPATPPQALIDASNDALGAYVVLFIKAPAQSQDVVRRTVEATRRIEALKGDWTLSRQLRAIYLSAPEPAVDALAGALRAFFSAQFGPALEKAASIADGEAFRPFLSYLKASCHVGLASYLRRDAVQAGSEAARQTLTSQHKEHVQRALEEFRKEPAFQASQLEIASIELQELEKGSDVPDELIRRVQGFSSSEELEHTGYHLLARVLQRRFQHRHGDKVVKNSELLRLLARAQNALRNAIRRRPAFNPAYLLLAETFLVSDRPESAREAAPAASGASWSRQVFTPSLEKAIDVLRAAPSPDDAVTERLAQLLEVAGRHSEATPLLEGLASSGASAEAFAKLLANYLRTGSRAAALFLDEPVPSREQLEGVSEERYALLLQLKASFDRVPEQQGIRHLMRAVTIEKAAGATANEAKKKQLRARLIEEYAKALDAYESRGLQPPVVLLNNLAWYLAGEDDPAKRSRAVELAERARALVPGTAKMPDLHDTHGWALYRSGRVPEAERVLRELLREADSPQYRYHLAKVLYDLKKFDDALAEVRRARESSRPFPEEADARELEVEIKEARRRALGQ
ncbi:MAG: hypothetical protein HY721_18010 [Planctomycetes bacterium]|nr:hypothetical protein [Planctomycetota bacterium]